MEKELCIICQEYKKCSSSFLMLNFCCKCSKMLYNGKIELTESMKKATIIINDNDDN